MCTCEYGLRWAVCTRYSSRLFLILCRGRWWPRSRHRLVYHESCGRGRISSNDTYMRWCYSDCFPISISSKGERSNLITVGSWRQLKATMGFNGRVQLSILFPTWGSNKYFPLFIQLLPITSLFSLKKFFCGIKFRNTFLSVKVQFISSETWLLFLIPFPPLQPLLPPFLPKTPTKLKIRNNLWRMGLPP